MDIRNARIWVTGASGMLAHDIIDLLIGKVGGLLVTTRRECDITNPSIVDATSSRFEPSVIINCAAYTAVDACETDKDACMAVNGDGPKNLAEAAKETGALLVHFSTDYVFDGKAKEPIKEAAKTGPKSQYGKSKLAGEEAITASGCKHLIIRTSGLYGVHGTCFPRTMARLFSEKREPAVVTDQVTVPTYTHDLAESVIKLLECDADGFVNVVNSGHCSWFEFAKEIAVIRGYEPEIVKETTTEEFGAPAPRPAFSVLSTERYTKLTGHEPRSWQDALKAYFDLVLQSPYQ